MAFRTTHQCLFMVAAAASVALGCAPAARATPEGPITSAIACDAGGIGPADAIEAADVSTTDTANPEEVALPDPSSVWVGIDNAVVYPSCAAVLVAPDVAVAGSLCFAVHASRIRVGLGVPTETGGIPVREVRSLSADARLVALLLETPVDGVRPAMAAPAHAAGSVRSVALGYAPRGQPASLSLWQGILEIVGPDTVVVPDAHANCHGDLGAGVFTLAGMLTGIVIGRADSEGGACARAFLLVPTDGSDEDGPLAQARGLSRARPASSLD